MNHRLPREYGGETTRSPPIWLGGTPSALKARLLEQMFGEDQRSSLSDALQAALMLAYNQRRLG